MLGEPASQQATTPSSVVAPVLTPPSKHRSWRPFAALIAVVAVVASSIGVYAAVKKPTTAQIKVSTYDANGKPLAGVVVDVTANGNSADQCSGGSHTTDASGTATFTGCSLAHGTKGSEKYIVVMAFKSGYTVSTRSPIKLLSGRFVVKAGKTTPVRLGLVSVSTNDCSESSSSSDNVTVEDGSPPADLVTAPGGHKAGTPLPACAAHISRAVPVYPEGARSKR